MGLLRFARNDMRGITVVEVLVAVALFGFLIVSIAWIFLTSWKSNSIVWEQLATQNEGRKATQDFVNELRTASASSGGAYAIESAATSSIVFYSNIDADTFKERVRYFLSGATLKKGVIKPTGDPFVYNPANEIITEVAHDVAMAGAPIFTYYNANFSGYSSPLPAPVTTTMIRVVNISLKLEEDPHLSPAPFNIESKVMIRNLKDN
ncbi:hypothetical protein EPN28_01475 [Patescibacteria group bacterium]|nr:MAG: hypothetical protein EPN28_01475 [Patescibacteria group bacterium]